MSDLKELYQEVILDHNKKPRNFRVLEDANHHAEGYNPLCGDRLTLYLKLVDGVIEDVGFQGVGCAISMASASLMSESVKGKDLERVQKLFEAFHSLVTGGSETPASADELEKLAVFHGVSDYPVRVKCATLPWHTLQAALTDNPEPVSTE